MESFNPKRLEQARRRRGLTRRGLARKTGIAERTLGYNEAGKHLPSSEYLDLLARTLEFPEGFFFLDDPEPVPSAIVSFRSMSRMTSGQRNRALAAAEMALEFSTWLDRHFQLPRPDFPDLRYPYDPEAAATILRSHWCLGDKPITNMIHLLEKRGVRVFSLAEDAEALDAFSFWKDDRPYVFLNSGKSGERGRYDTAHELGHLVMHRHGEAEQREAEREADQFAACFLMPRSSVAAHQPAVRSLDNLVRAKSYWKVSVLALARRMHEIGSLTDWRYRQVCIEVQRRGIRKLEPRPIERETSQVLQKVFSILWTQKLTRETVADELGWPAEELDALTFRLILSEARPTEDADDREKRRAKLRLV